RLEGHDAIARREGILFANPGLGREVTVRDIAPEIEENGSSLRPPILGVRDGDREARAILQPHPFLSHGVARERYRRQRLQRRQEPRHRVADWYDSSRRPSRCV